MAGDPGDLGTVPVQHRAGFAVYNAISAAGLGTLAQGVPSGNGLVLPGAARTTSVTWKDNANHEVAGIDVPGGEAGQGALYELLAWGLYHDNNNAVPQDFTVGVWWGAVSFGVPHNFKWGDHQLPTAPARWRIHAIANVLGTSEAHASTLATFARQNPVNNTVRSYLLGPPDAVAVGLTTDQRFRVMIQQNQNGGGQMLTVLGSRGWKSA